MATPDFCTSNWDFVLFFFLSSFIVGRKRSELKAEAAQQDTSSRAKLTFRDGGSSESTLFATPSKSSLSLALVSKAVGSGKEAKQRVLQWRRQYFSHRLSVSYANSDPLMIIKGEGSRLIDESGFSYLDTRNNVAHCGHGHVRVVQAVQDQVAMLNTNTRYLHPNIVMLGQRILSKFPPQLCKIFFCNSGSEANDMALRLAKAYNRQGSLNTIVVQGAYHGHTMAVLDISPYKFLKGTEYELVPQPNLNINNSESSSSTTATTTSPISHNSESRIKTPGHHIWQVPVPDVYRGLHRDPTTAGALYAQYVEDACRYFTQTRGGTVRAFIIEGGLSIGGVVLPPAGYLQRCARAVREAGGVYIADEVQTGFGRLGSSFWAFEYQPDASSSSVVVPDIVTLGKPIGNGMPLAAVVCTEAVAQAFESKGVEYFNTFGGNPVSCAAGLAVLDVMEEEHLQQHALEVGTYMKQEFERVATQQIPLIGSVRGSGLFLGVELVKDRTTLQPATAETHLICSILRQKYQVLTSIDGIHDNVFVIKPPMVFSKDDVDYFVQSFVKAVVEDLPLHAKELLSGVIVTPT
ncbi:hypothetical protein ACA910_002682 [Epithemia clementina (nom. ined.)]